MTCSRLRRTCRSIRAESFSSQRSGHKGRGQRNCDTGSVVLQYQSKSEQRDIAAVSGGRHELSAVPRPQYRQLQHNRDDELEWLPLRLGKRHHCTFSGSTATASVIAAQAGRQNASCTFHNARNVNSPTITTLLSASSGAIGATVNDTSALAGQTADAGGTVKYRWYSTLASCQAGTVGTPGGNSAGDKTVTNGIVPPSDSVQFNTAGTFYWRAFYTGDAFNNSASSVCTDETLVIGPNSPSIATTLSNRADQRSATRSTTRPRCHGCNRDCGWDGQVHAVYSNSTAATVGWHATPATRRSTNHVVPDSDGVQFNTAGTFYWRAATPVTPTTTAPPACARTRRWSSAEGLAFDRDGALFELDHGRRFGQRLVHARPMQLGLRVGRSRTPCTRTTCARPGWHATPAPRRSTNGVVPDSNSLQFNSAGDVLLAGRSTRVTPTTTAPPAPAPRRPGSRSELAFDRDDAVVRARSRSAIRSVTRPRSVRCDCDCGWDGQVHACTRTDTCSHLGRTRRRQQDGRPTASCRTPTRVQFNSAGNFYWQAVYSGDSNNTGRLQHVPSETLVVGPNSAVDHDDAVGSGPDQRSDVGHDSSTSVVRPRMRVGRSRTRSTRTTRATLVADVTPATKTVINGVVPDSDSRQFNSAGTFYWQAIYSGDPTTPARSPARAERDAGGQPERPSITTTLSDLGPISDRYVGA